MNPDSRPIFDTQSSRPSAPVPLSGGAFSPQSELAWEGGSGYTGIWSEVMAQICDICGKGPQFGNNISHAHNVSRRRWNVNLQVVKALVNGAPKRLRVCASCIKSGKIAKA